jgi:hypothetical protein
MLTFRQLSQPINEPIRKVLITCMYGAESGR